MHLRPLLANASLAAFAIAFCLGLAEAALCVLGIAPLAELFGGTALR